MRNFTVDEERFKLLKDQLRRSYRNFSLEPPYQHALYYLSYLTQDTMWTNQEKLDELDAITAKDIQDFYPSLLSQLQIEALVHGNLTNEDATNMLHNTIGILNPKELSPDQRVTQHSLILPTGSKYVYRRNVEDPKNVNSGIEYLIQVGNVTQTALRARLSLLAQIAQEPCFDQLRTKEQLGYLVFSGVRKQTGSMGLRFILQSERDTIYLENRIEEFLFKLKSIVENMSETEYRAQVKSLISKKLEKDKNLGQEGGKYWTHIHSGYYEFDQVEKDVSELELIEKQDLLQFMTDYIDPNAPHSRKLSVHIQSQKTIPPPKFKVDIESLHTCLVSQGVTRLSIEDVCSAVEQGDAGEASIQANLRELLVNQTDDEEVIEGLIAKLMVAMRKSDGTDGSLINVDNTKTARRLSNADISEVPQRDHSQLPQGNHVIANASEFKKHMELSPAATPLIQF
jgi:insulysin